MGLDPLLACAAALFFGEAMPWYETDLIKCHGCRRRFSTPIDKLEHARYCKAKKLLHNGKHIAKVGTHGSEAITVTRGYVDEGSVISFLRSNGAKCRGKITMINEACIFISLL
jgi:hypothetical protein